MSEQVQRPGEILEPDDPRVQRVVAVMNEVGIDFRGQPIPMPWGTIIPNVLPVVVEPGIKVLTSTDKQERAAEAKPPESE